jgi:hypothetical protein
MRGGEEMQRKEKEKIIEKLYKYILVIMEN